MYVPGDAAGPGWYGRRAMAKRVSAAPKPRVAAIDLGRARVGVAVADELGLMAHTRPFLDGRSKKPLLAALVELAREESLQGFLVGLPLEMNGEHGPAARRAVAFAEELSAAAGLPVEMCDERWSTREAGRRLRDGGVNARGQKALVDGASAAVILQSWLDRRGG
jgi:putative Holliday junction resolvase